MILVIGAQGQVGRALAARGLEAVGRPDADLGAPETLPALIAAHRPDLVINTGALTIVDEAERDPARAMALNADGAGAVAEACTRIGAPLIHLSTDYVFSGDKGAAYVEVDAPGPLNAYGVSKLAGERAVAQAQPQSVIVRTSWVHAPAGRNFVRLMLSLAQTRLHLTAATDQRACPTFADDLAAALITLAAMIRDGAEPWGILHLAGAGAANRYEFARAIFEQSAKHDGPIADVAPTLSANFPSPARRPVNSELDCSKAAHDLGLNLPPWRDGLERCIARIAAEGWQVS